MKKFENTVNVIARSSDNRDVGGVGNVIARGICACLLRLPRLRLAMPLATLTFVLVLSIGITSESQADISCVFSDNGKTLTIIGKGNDTYSYSSCTIDNSSSPDVDWVYNSKWKQSNMDTINISGGISELAGYAFNGIKAQKVTISDSVTGWGSYVFQGAAVTSIFLGQNSRPAAYPFSEKIFEIVIPDAWADNFNPASFNGSAFNRSCFTKEKKEQCPSGARIVCQGEVEKCKDALAKVGGHGNCTFANSNCIDPDVIVPATETQCTGSSYYWSGKSCNNKKNGIVCADGFKRNEDFCNRVRYTPAEAAAVANDDNTNVVTLTFKK